MLDLLRRKEGIRRIPIGLSGLAGVVLLVGLANIVVDNVRRDEAAVADAANDGSAAYMAETIMPPEKPTEPLAELGVTPAPEASAPSVVQDLQPDPNLREPLDQPSPNPPQTTPPAPQGQ